MGGRGRGSNMKALSEACARAQVPADVVLVVSSKEDAPAVQTAKDLGLKVEIVSPSRDDYGQALRQVLSDSGCEWICLAGYMRLLPAEVLEAFPLRVLNIHPALLPKFGGKGMYGLKVHEAVLAAGETESGCTVHFVNERYDEGAIILQLRCPVLLHDTPETLAARVLDLEHIGYPQALAKVIHESQA